MLNAVEHVRSMSASQRCVSLREVDNETRWLSVGDEFVANQVWMKDTSVSCVSHDQVLGLLLPQYEATCMSRCLPLKAHLGPLIYFKWSGVPQVNTCRQRSVDLVDF